MTHAGVIFGTAAYMSPEQARGKAVDKRADIWAFGCVLYEMLTGRQAFRGETIQDTLAAVLGREPDWSLLPADTPASVVRLLRRCLEKDPDRRLHDIADARIEIEDADARNRLPSLRGAPARRFGLWLPWRLIAIVVAVWRSAASGRPNSGCDTNGEAVADRAARGTAAGARGVDAFGSSDKRRSRSLRTGHAWHM